jgi:hypothetical protein
MKKEIEIENEAAHCFTREVIIKCEEFNVRNAIRIT